MANESTEYVREFLRHLDERLLRALTAAPTDQQFELADLIAAGCPHYLAFEFLRKAEQHQWSDQSGYLSPGFRQALQDHQAPSPIVSQRALDRLPAEERPRERLLRLGAKALSAEELLAILLRTGSADRGVLELARDLIADHDGLLGLAEKDYAELTEIAGLGEAKIASLAAALEIGRRLGQAARRPRPPLTDPHLVAELLAHELTPLGHEEFWCLPLDARCRLIGEPRRISKGDIDGTEAGPRAFFRTALKAGAVQAIAAHNHPTGNPGPSSADQQVTNRLIAAGQTVDCALLDHLIIGDQQRWYSFRRSQSHLFQSDT
jgi:DNA repair protein RadC